MGLGCLWGGMFITGIHISDLEFLRSAGTVYLLDAHGRLEIVYASIRAILPKLDCVVLNVDRGDAVQELVLTPACDLSIGERVTIPTLLYRPGCSIRQSVFTACIREHVAVRRYDYTSINGECINVPHAQVVFIDRPFRIGMSGAPIFSGSKELIGIVHGNAVENRGSGVFLSTCDKIIVAGCK
jgi:hypothetical protein